MPMNLKTLAKITKGSIGKMVPRIFRADICRTCRPSKFHRPKLYAYHNRLKSTNSSDQKNNEISRCKKCQRIIDYTFGPPKFGGCNNFRMPNAITQTTVTDTEKGDDKNKVEAITLMEALKHRIQSRGNPHAAIPQHVGATHAEKKETEIVVDRRDMTAYKSTRISPLTFEESFVRATTIDADKHNEEKLLQRPEPIERKGERRAVFDPPHLKSSFIRYSRYHEKKKEAQMFDELAKKYLRAERDQIDKRLPQEMERLGLTHFKSSSEPLSPTININIIPCDPFDEQTKSPSQKQNTAEIEIPPKEDAPEKIAESQKATMLSYSTPQYYEQISWCNHYFKPHPGLAEVPIVNINTESADLTEPVYGEFNLQPDDLIPFNIPCFESTLPIPGLESSEFDPRIEKLIADENQPLHYVLQQTLIDFDNTSAPKTNVVIREHRDIIIPSEGIKNHHDKTEDADVFNSLRIPDADVTKYDYVCSRDFEPLINASEVNATILTTTANEANLGKVDGPERSGMYQTIENTKEPFGQTDPIEQNQAETISENDGKQKAEEPERLTSSNVIKTEVAEHIDVPPTVEETFHSANRKYPVVQSVQTIPETTDKHYARESEFLTQANLTGVNNSDQIDVFHYPMEETFQPYETMISMHAQIEPETDQVQMMGQAEHLTRIDLMEASLVARADTFLIMEELQQPISEIDADVTKYDYTLCRDLEFVLNNQEDSLITNSGIDTQSEMLRANITQIIRTTKEPKHSVKETDPVVQFATQTIPRTEEDQKLAQSNVMGPDATEPIDRIVSRSINNELQDLSRVGVIETNPAKQASEMKELKQPTRETQAMVQNCIQAPATMKTVEEHQAVEQPETLAKTNISIHKTRTMEEPEQAGSTSDTMAHSCVQAQALPKLDPGNKVAPEPSNNTTKTDDDDLTKLNLDSNLSLTELLRRVRARNRLQYCNEIRTQLNNHIMSATVSAKQCPPTDKPQCPPPPECHKACPPPAKKPKNTQPQKCPKAPKCPDIQPKTPPDPPKCPPGPPGQPKCEADPSPCTCPPPSKCPPPPPKCQCHSTDPDAPITTYCGQCVGNGHNMIGIIKQGLFELKNKLILISGTKDPRLESKTLHLNRIKDFEPWAPIPSWPYPVPNKKNKLQCPYHGCPWPKPGPVRPNCPELPCSGFPKRLTFSEASS